MIYDLPLPIGLAIAKLIFIPAKFLLRLYWYAVLY
jgi:hypothetical protein